MNWNPLLGILAFVYSCLVLYIAAKKPLSIWDMTKTKAFRKVLGDKGTVIFFYIWGVVFIGVGLWLIIIAPI
ncbi:MAG: hypothetical protein ABF289_09200 [Clostridiales bacterium]